MLEDKPIIIFLMFCSLVIGAVMQTNLNYQVIEHKIEHYCTDIGSELQSYDRDDELVCENGATFTYKLEDE